jgi:low affinity Fe/Cu permease
VQGDRRAPACLGQATSLFARFTRWVEKQVGRSSTFILAISVVVLWAASGPIVGWSDTWQLIINTGTTIVTFLMVFVIQNTQSRDTQAMQLKLDELVSNVSFIRRSDEFLESIKKGGSNVEPVSDAKFPASWENTGNFAL